MTPEEFEKLPARDRQAAIDDHNENVREWSTTCPICGHHMRGTLQEIRAFYARCDRLCKHGQPTE